MSTCPTHTFLAVALTSLSSLVGMSAWGQAPPFRPAMVRLLPTPAAVVPAPRPIQGVSHQEPQAPTVSLSDLEAQALRQNPTLAQAAARIDAAYGRWVQVGLPPNPTLSYVGSEVGNNGSAGQQGAFVGKKFITGNKLALNRQEACHQLAVLEQQYQAQRLRVLTDVRLRFYDALFAERTLELARQLVKVGENSVESIDAMLKAQEASQVELLQAQVEMQTARLRLDNASARYEAAWRRLAAVLGDPAMSPVALVGDVELAKPQLGWGDALGQLLTRSPQLAASNAAAERARAAYQRALVEAVPDLDVRAGVQYDTGSDDTIATVQVGLPIPLVNRNQGGIRRARAEIVVAENERARLELSLRQRLAEVFQRYESARRQTDRYAQDILPPARESLEKIAAGYRQGEFGYLALLTAQRTYFQVELDYLRGLETLNTSYAEIEGLLLRDSLE